METFVQKRRKLTLVGKSEFSRIWFGRRTSWSALESGWRSARSALFRGPGGPRSNLPRCEPRGPHSGSAFPKFRATGDRLYLSSQQSSFAIILENTFLANRGTSTTFLCMLNQ
jgi:hypothetical protein